MRRGVIEAIVQLLRTVIRSQQSGSRSGSRSGDRASGNRRRSSGNERRRPSTDRSQSDADRRPQPASTVGGVGDRIEYSPCLDGDPDPGEIVWTWVPYEEDPSQGKDRPVIIIGRRGARLIAVPLTSKHRDDEAQVEVGRGSWDPQQRVSYAKVERLLEVDPEQVRREGAVLSRDRFDDVVAGVRAAAQR